MGAQDQGNSANGVAKDVHDPARVQRLEAILLSDPRVAELLSLVNMDPTHLSEEDLHTSKYLLSPTVNWELLNWAPIQLTQEIIPQSNNHCRELHSYFVPQLTDSYRRCLTSEYSTKIPVSGTPLWWSSMVPGLPPGI